MLITARNAREVRVALMQGDRLYDLDTENLDGSQCKANIYKGVVARVEGSLEAAFINYGAQRHGFLPLKEIARDYFKSSVKQDYHAEISIKDAIKEGQEVLVQVEKEERGNKGAALTTFISLAGSFLVLMPNNAHASGISRQIDGQEREALKDKFRALKVPEGMGVIIRTAGVDRSLEELESDLAMLLERWETIKKAAKRSRAPALIHREDDVVVRALRDYMRHEVDEIWVDNQTLFERAKHYLAAVRPDMVAKLHLYDGVTPLFCRYRIEQQIESVFNRVVKLPSGGSISIDPTEALISIDVNSARATGGSDIEDTALNTNLEAAEEIARQLRIRDIGGLVVIDFIDMASAKNQRAVSQRLREALSFDRARVKVGFITRFGLLEMSRQRIRSDLDSISQKPCPCCEGRGSIRTVEALASSLMRMIEEEASRSLNKNYRDQEFQIIAPLELASYLTNEYREVLESIAQQFNVYIRVLPSRLLEMPTYELRRLKNRESAVSYLLTESTQQPAWMDAGVAEVVSNRADHRYHTLDARLEEYAAHNVLYSANQQHLSWWQRVKQFFGHQPQVSAPSSALSMAPAAPLQRDNKAKSKNNFKHSNANAPRHQGRDVNNAPSNNPSNNKAHAAPKTDKRGVATSTSNQQRTDSQGHKNANNEAARAPRSSALDRSISSNDRLRHTAERHQEVSASINNVAPQQNAVPAPSPTEQEPPAPAPVPAPAPKKRAFEHLGPVAMDAKPQTGDNANESAAFNSSNEAAAAPRAKPASASNHIALFRSGLLGPVATTVEVPLDLDDLDNIPSQTSGDDAKN